jgi:hypothetical protein
MLGYLVNYDLNRFRESLREANFIIAGAGTQTSRIINYIKPLRPKFIIDGDSKKWGNVLDGYYIYPPFYRDTNPLNVAVIATLNYFPLAYELQKTHKDISCLLTPIELIYGYV